MSSERIGPEEEKTTATGGQLLRRLSVALISGLVASLLSLLGSTLRITITYDEGSIHNLDELHPGILPFWHRCLLVATWVFRKRNLAVLTSESRDGDYISAVITRFGYRPIRGSSSRGGLRGLLRLQEYVRRGGGVALAIDGPRGPRYQAKRGPVILARQTGVPITPFYVAVDRAWVLRSWDAFVIPKPFARVHARFGKQIVVPDDAEGEAVAQYHAQLQAGLEAVTASAEMQCKPEDQ